ncbi:Ypt/Rab-GAP domain of gyp1p superfamily protein isoform 1 [Hibiscus syriacus]|uniref:Ypt/Rab-GAP domain of gyp1p superfamily protein isoform 1 n=1 Tax=Hibiscus syriacus TaxID=106335 RepID=A0A6A3AHF1_HIBSY|nr:Ypt/Rab-GAP domain of gyp1p superfamily protein isoform 1 [Hibiscus syriacus]
MLGNDGWKWVNFIFAESEKEPEMQIGLPTDVKHVAHIGWDGPSTVQSKPTWMNEFQTPPGEFQTPPLALAGEVENNSLSRKSSRGKSSAAKDTPQLPKSSKRTASITNGNGVPSTKDKADKSKQSKKIKKPKESNQATDSASKEPKKSKRKKVKELVGEGSSRRSRATESDTVSEAGSQFSYASDLIDGDGT